MWVYIGVPNLCLVFGRLPRVVLGGGVGGLGCGTEGRTLRVLGMFLKIFKEFSNVDV